MTTMLSIGELSKVTALTVKTLRLYDEKGLVPPALIDERTSYRYYDARSVDRARAVKALRDLEFSLEDIAAILKAGEDDGDVVHLLEKQRTLIVETLDKYQAVQRSLDVIIQRERESVMWNQRQAAQVTEKNVDDLWIATVRDKGVYGDSGKRFSTVARAVGRHIAGKPLNLFFDTEYKESDADFESGFPVDAKAAAAIAGKNGVVVRKLDGGHCFSLIHVGPYDKIGESYRAIFEKVRAAGATPRTPTREVYLKGPGMIFKGNPKKYVTEIQVLV